MRRFPPDFRRRLHRGTAVLGIALVLALNVLAAAPAAHAWLHEGASARACDHGPAETADSGDDCVVAQFAREGGGGLAAWSFPAGPESRCDRTPAPPAATPAPVRLRLLPPGCGPPAV